MNIVVKSRLGGDARFLLANEIDALLELDKDGDGNVTPEEEAGHDRTYDELTSIYASRRVVFTEGNKDPTSLKDGLIFYRLQMDHSVQVRTFLREDLFSETLVMVPESTYNKAILAGLSFKCGLRIVLPGSDDPEGVSPTKIGHFIELDPDYQIQNDANLGSTAFETDEPEGLNRYLDLTNPSFFHWQEVRRDADGHKGSHYIKDSTIDPENPEVGYHFDINLKDMFVYKEGRKPLDQQGVNDIFNLINETKDQKDWTITFDFYSTYIYEGALS